LGLIHVRVNAPVELFEIVYSSPVLAAVAVML
jgi:hypothetical protein